MKALEVTSIEVGTDDAAAEGFANGGNAEVRLFFNRIVSKDERKRIIAESSKCLKGEGERTKVSQEGGRITFHVRSSEPVELFVELVRSEGALWGDEAAQKVQDAKGELEGLSATLQRLV